MSATSKRDRDYLDGLLDGFDDLPDGAWAQCCQDAIRADRRFKNRDPYDVWIDWVENAQTRRRRFQCGHVLGQARLARHARKGAVIAGRALCIEKRAMTAQQLTATNEPWRVGSPPLTI